MTREETIQSYMEKLKISREEAEQLWEDDHSEEILPEVKEMEKKASKIKRRYEKSDTPRKKADRVKKEDPIRREIIATVANNLSRCVFDGMDVFDEPHLIHVSNPEREITFKVGSDEYSLVLTKHRTPK